MSSFKIIFVADKREMANGNFLIIIFSKWRKYSIAEIHNRRNAFIANQHVSFIFVEVLDEKTKRMRNLFSSIWPMSCFFLNWRLEWRHFFIVTKKVCERCEYLSLTKIFIKEGIRCKLDIPSLRNYYRV